MSDGFERIFKPYYEANPTTSHMAKDGIVAVGAPHPCGCRYCRGLMETDASRYLTKQVKDAGKRIDAKPSCASEK